MQGISDFQEAKQVIIELTLFYEGIARSLETTKKNSPKDYEKYFTTIAYKLKSKFLGQVVMEGEEGTLSEEMIDVLRTHAPFPLHSVDIPSGVISYKVVETNPKGEIRVSANTNVIVRPLLTR